MSSTYYHNDPESSESFENPRILNPNDSEYNHFVVRAVTEPDGAILDLEAGLDGIHQMPVSLPYLIFGLFLLANRWHARCPASNAPAVLRGESINGCSLASIALAAINPARL